MERWDLYTRDREKTGKTHARGEKLPKDTYHLVVHVCIFNAEGNMLIQRRQPFKHGWSDLWDLSVGGSAVAGEAPHAAAEREVLEELGIRLDLGTERPALTVHFPDGFDDIFLIQRDIPFSSLTLQAEEVAAVRWASEREILELINNGSFIPYHKSLIEALFFLKDHAGFHTSTDFTVPSAGQSTPE